MDATLLIGGAGTAALDGATFERRDPVTGAVATRAAAAKRADVERAVGAAAAAFPAWSGFGPKARRAVLARAADLLAARADDFVSILAAETGATAPWVLFNVGLAADMLREAAAMTTQITGEIIPSDKPGTFAMAIRRPVGVIVGMAPWNAPVILPVRAMAMPLACGNTVVFKASERCPAAHRLIGEVLQEAGLPAGAVNVLTHAAGDAPEVVSALIAHPKVKRISFTGSTRVGRIVAEQAGRHLKPVLLELGGKAPLVVLDDADIDAAVNAAVFGSFLNQGQICMSTERIVVDDSVADSFVERLAARAKALPAGNPRDHVVLGAVVDPAAADNINALIEDALAKGAVAAAGGTAEGTILPATVLDRVGPAMRIYHEESFGPVVTVVRATDAEDAIRIANDTDYGLSAAVFGRDVKRALAVAERIETGICHVNGPTVADEAQMPFGGVKGSGFGRFGGRAAIHEFTELRWITVEDAAQPYPF
jgi:acyl-CoA reductase-like NAD-dependent aldehyde dehydrogenase